MLCNMACEIVVWMRLVERFVSTMLLCRKPLALNLLVSGSPTKC